MSDFREDGRAAVDWVADYLDRVGELPVLAQVEPGDIRARLPASPPEQGEPFAAVLQDLDEVRASDLAGMMERAMAAAASGTDMLAEWRASSEAALAAARVRLAGLRG